MEGYSIADIERFAALMYSTPIDNLYLVPYSYPINFETLAADEVRPGILTMSANADFIALGIRHFAMTSGDISPTIMSKIAGDFRCLISDTSSGDQFTNGGALLENYGTNGVGEILFDFPRLIAGRTALSVQVTNLTGVEVAVLQLSIHGVLVRAWSDRPPSGQIR